MGLNDFLENVINGSTPEGSDRGRKNGGKQKQIFLLLTWKSGDEDDTLMPLHHAFAFFKIRFNLDSTNMICF
jgi:hypothetical protein